MTNQPGVELGGDVRAAHVAVWRRADLGPDRQGLATVPPLLAVEVAGRDDRVEKLLEKARWYLAHGVAVVWVLDPATRRARVVTGAGTSEHGPGERLPEHAALPGLAPAVADLFRQLGPG